MTETATVTRNAARTHALTVRLWLACLASQEQLTVYLGIKLGLYDALALPATPDELALRAGVGARYAREWLEQQAVAGILDIDDPAKAPADRVYSLCAEHRAVLTASDDPASIGSVAVLPLGGVARALPALLDAYRSGAGLRDEAYGEDWREGHSGANRAVFTHQLPGWIRLTLPDVDARLCVGGLVADVGCGAGWSTIALARAYPASRLHGFDIDPECLAQARVNAAAAGVADRVTFEVRDGGDPHPGATGRYDLVCLLDVLHEMPHPVPMLRSCRALRAPAGCVLVMDARVAEAFTAPADEVERFQYATSVLHCLPVGAAGSSPAETGTAMRPDTVSRYARQAGFAGVDVLKAGDRFHRLYRLVG